MSLIPYWSDFERPLRHLEREFFRPGSYYEPFHQLMPRDFFAPQFFKPWENVLRPWEDQMRRFEDVSNAMSRLALDELQGTKITSDDKQFQLNVDVQHFTPEEVSVTVKDGYVLVQGKHEEKRDRHGYVSRQFVRRYALPEGCLPDTVESKLSSDGVLTVTAPKVLALPSIGERIIPIAHTGPVKKESPSQELKSIK